MARTRSPAYPALSLPAAIDMIRKVHSEQQSTPEPREVVAEHMGYSGISGRSDKAISALIKYGLLEKVGSEGLRVTSRAVSILYPDPEDPSAKEEALLAASRGPALFEEIFERWNGRPSESSLQAFLIRNSFNVNAVENVARSFYETFDLISGLGDSYDSSSRRTEDDKEQICADTPTRSENQDGVKRSPPPVQSDGRLPTNVTKPIFDFETVQIATKIDNQEDLAKLIARLEQIKPMLPEFSEDVDFEPIE